MLSQTRPRVYKTSAQNSLLCQEDPAALLADSCTILHLRSSCIPNDAPRRTSLFPSVWRGYVGFKVLLFHCSIVPQSSHDILTHILAHAPWRLFLHLRLFSLSPHFTCSFLEFGIPEQSFTIHRLADQIRCIVPPQSHRLWVTDQHRKL